MMQLSLSDKQKKHHKRWKQGQHLYRCRDSASSFIHAHMTNRVASRSIAQLLATDLSFLPDHVRLTGGLEIQLLPFDALSMLSTKSQKSQKQAGQQVYDSIAFCAAFQRQMVNDLESCVDQIAAYHVSDNEDDAHIIMKLTNGYWAYLHVMSCRQCRAIDLASIEYSKLDLYGADDLTCHVHRELGILIQYGIAANVYDRLGIVW